jgi:pimeloyl-ACP methyl ester carboxylesterase
MTTRIEPSTHPSQDDDVVLSDGRRLRYALWGEPDGRPVLLVSASPGSRLLCPDLAATERAGVRLITVDRPGSGGSDPHPQPTMKVWAADVAVLLDHLDVERADIVGWSGGGHFALAVAALCPQRVSSLALAGTPAPANDEQVSWVPEELRTVVELVRRDAEGAVAAIAAANQWYVDRPELAIDLWSEQGDHALRHQAAVEAAMSTMLREGARQGAAGLVYDIVAGSLDWGFDLADVEAPVGLWYGSHDPVVTPEHGQFYATRLPNPGQVHVQPLDHLLVMPLWSEILDR